MTERPKKNISAYLHYVSEKRPAMKKANPDMPFGELSRRVAEDWNKLPAGQKKKFEDIAAKDKIRYENECRAWLKANPGQSLKKPKKEKKGKKGKKEKDPNAPKRNISAYMFFASDERKKLQKIHPGKPMGEISKMIGQKWGLLSDRDKAPYQKMADEDKIRYEKATAAYQKKQAGKR